MDRELLDDILDYITILYSDKGKNIPKLWTSIFFY